MPGKPYLYVNVNVMPDFEGLVVFSIIVELNQKAALQTDGSLVTVATWSAGQVGAVGRRRLDSVRDVVRDLVDKFINAYLSVHPRPAGK
jgi:hypothetical protein